MFCMETTKCSCGCDKCKCEFNPCAVTCGQCVKDFGDYAYIYNITEQEVEENEAVEFSSNGSLSGSITHIAGSENIVINRTGVYLINFYVNSDDDSRITVYRNGEPIQGSTYDVDDGANYGQLIAALQTGDVITLVNTGNNDIDLDDAGNGAETVVNASMTFVRLF